MTEVEICGGGHRTRLMINLCVYGVPPPPYIKEWRRGRAGLLGHAPRGFPTPTRSRLPPFLVQLGGGRKGRGREGKGGRPPSPIRIGLGGRAPPLGSLLLSSTKAHEGPLTLRGVPVTPRYSGKCPNLSETFPVSKHNLPIYQSLCLDHFKTPRHVRDHIRDSEQPSVHQIT